MFGNNRRHLQRQLQLWPVASCQLPVAGCQLAILAIWAVDFEPRQVQPAGMQMRPQGRRHLAGKIF